MQKNANMSNATWDLLLYLSYVDTSWQRKISILHQRSTTCVLFLLVHVPFADETSNSCALYQFFGLERPSSLADFARVGDLFCSQDLPTLRKHYPNQSDEAFFRYCFSSAYIVALLHDSLGVPLNDKRQAY
jgi:hypothetical protein